jgi:hypothetical protein
MADLLLGEEAGPAEVPERQPREGEDAVDGNGREGGAYRPRPRGLGRPTKRSVTFIIFAVLIALVAVAVLMLGLA